MRLPATENEAERALRLAMRKTAAPSSIARGETPQEARVMFTVTAVPARVPLAVGAIAKSSAASARELNCLTGRLWRDGLKSSMSWQWRNLAHAARGQRSSTTVGVESMGHHRDENPPAVVGPDRATRMSEEGDACARTRTRLPSALTVSTRGFLGNPP